MHHRRVRARVVIKPFNPRTQLNATALLIGWHVSMHLRGLAGTRVRQRTPDKHRSTLWPNVRASQVARNAVILTAHEWPLRRSD